RRTGRGPLQPRPVRAWDWPKTWRQGAGLTQIAGYLPAALLGRAVGHPVRTLDKSCLVLPVPFRPSLLPRAGAGAISVFLAKKRRGVFRAQAGTEVGDLPAAGQSAVRDNHRSGGEVDHRREAVSIRSA